MQLLWVKSFVDWPSFLVRDCWLTWICLSETANWPEFPYMRWACWRQHPPTAAPDHLVAFAFLVMPGRTSLISFTQCQLHTDCDNKTTRHLNQKLPLKVTSPISVAVIFKVFQNTSGSHFLIQGNIKNQSVWMRVEHVTTQSKHSACNNWSNESYITITSVRPLFTVIAATSGITAV